MSGQNHGQVAAVGLTVVGLGSASVAAAVMNLDRPYFRGKWKYTERWFGRAVSRWMLGVMGCTVDLFGMVLIVSALL